MEEITVSRQRTREKWKNLAAFWIFGLCNNYGNVVMLTAAVDLISSFSLEPENVRDFSRECTKMSTGTVLLADIIPSFVIKLLSPFLPYNASARVFIACSTTAISFLTVASASSKSVILVGVALTSFASGLGEPSFLTLSTQYNKNVVSAWSSGTGAAGIVGALSYSLMKEIGLSSYETLVLMIIVPMVELIIYTIVLSSPRESRTRNNATNESNENNETDALISRDEAVNEHRLTLAEKLKYIPKLLIYIIPLILVYFFEYFINQGLFELMYFKNIFLTKEQQYRWYQVTYQIGVFLSRSSVNIIHIKKTWIMALVQGLIAMFLLTESIYLFIPSISIIFVTIFIEGLQGGLAYVNTYYRMSIEIDNNHKPFAMNVVTVSDCIGIIFAGFLAISTHDWICQLPVATNI